MTSEARMSELAWETGTRREGIDGSKGERQFGGALYHAIDRGDRREPIFQDDVDRERFLKTLGEACARTGRGIHAWVLKGDRHKLEMTALVRQRTTVSNTWLAEKLHLGPSRVSQATRDPEAGKLAERLALKLLK